jgi:pimeloyl-ACP methyl ester carboxylesterase
MNIARKVGRWFLVAMLCIVATTGIAGFIYQSIAQSSDLFRWPPPGRLFDVNGKKMHIYCQGVGSPTVVVEQGNGGYYDHWHDMNRELSGLTRVCAYDRAGMGYSASLGRVVGTDEVASRLHQLLSAADITDDLILVGWSAGGIHVRNYYKQFPNNVAGIILVDSSHEQQQSRMFDPTPPEGFDTRRLGAFLAPLGVVRLSGEIERAVSYGPGSDEHKQRTSAVQNQSHWLSAYLAEFNAFDLDQRMNQTPPSLGNLPLIVLTRGKEVQQGGMPSYYTLEILQEREDAWQMMQKELTALSTQGRQIIARESGHSIHLDQPELIFGAVQEMLTKVRSSQDESND